MTLQSLKAQALSRPEMLCVVMLLGLLPLVFQYVLFHPDEQYYVDAGVKMIETGDFLTPLTPDGELRLRKPIIPYWFVLAGYETFGISAFGSRIGFVLGACLLVWLTWKTAELAFESRLAGMLAALIAMCHPAVLISAARSVPDMCLALFTVLSCYGFVAMIRKQRVTVLSLFASYGGGVLAVLSKGIPAAAFVVFATAFMVLRERKLIVSAWFRFTLAIVGAIVGSLSWFAVMWVQHREELISQFIGDQVGEKRFAAEFLQIALQFPLIVFVLGLSLSPWLLPNWKGIVRSTSSIRALVVRSDVQLLLSWCCVYVGLAATIKLVTMRYLLPIVPLLAVFVGGFLSSIPLNELQRPLQKLLRATLVLTFVAAGFFTLLHWTAHPAVAGLLGVVACLVIVTCWFQCTAWETPAIAVSVGCALYAAIGLTSWGAYPFLFPSSADQVAQSLQNESDPRPLLLISDRHPGGLTQAAKLRVAFAGRRQVVLAKPDQPNLRSGDYCAVLSEIPTAEILSGESWKYQQVPLGFPNITWQDAVGIAKSANIQSALARLQTECVLAKRIEPTTSAANSRFATSSTLRVSH